MLTRRVVLLGIAATATAPRIGSAQNAANVVRVGMVMPLTGTLAAAGRQVVDGARLYMNQHGDAVAGKRIELLVKDDTSSFDTGKRLIQEAILNDKADIIAGGTTGDLLASAPVITESKVPTVIMLSSTSTAIDKSPYFVRTSCTLAQSSAIIADWAIKNGIKRVVVLTSDFAPGHEAEATFKAVMSRPAARSRKLFPGCRYKILTSRHSCSAPATPARKPCSSSFHRYRPASLPGNSSNAASTRLGSG